MLAAYYPIAWLVFESQHTLVAWNCNLMGGGGKALPPQHAVSNNHLSCTCGVHTDKYMQTQQVHSDTNLDLKGCPFIPIAGILELVNRTLVDRIPMLTWRRKEGDKRRNYRIREQYKQRNVVQEMLRRQQNRKGKKKYFNSAAQTDSFEHFLFVLQWNKNAMLPKTLAMMDSSFTTRRPAPAAQNFFLSPLTRQTASFSALLPFMVVQFPLVYSERQHCQLSGRALPAHTAE